MSTIDEVFGSEQEFKKVCEGFFQKFDKGKNGYIGNAEFKQGLQDFAQENGISSSSMQKIIDSYDQNKDGKISLDVFSNALRETCASADK